MIDARLLATDGPLDRRFEVSRLCVFDKRLLWLWQVGIRPAAEPPFRLVFVTRGLAARRSTSDCRGRRIGETAGKVVARETTASV